MFLYWSILYMCMIESIRFISSNSNKKEKSKEYSFYHPSKCKSSMMPDWFLYLEVYGYTYIRKNSTMMTVLLLQHRHISSSNKRDESPKRRGKRKKERDEIFIFICVVHKWNLRWFTKKNGTIIDVSWYFNAIENTHGFFFKGNNDDDG
jgi:hypothetical protein